MRRLRMTAETKSDIMVYGGRRTGSQNTVHFWAYESELDPDWKAGDLIDDYHLGQPDGGGRCWPTKGVSRAEIGSRWIIETTIIGLMTVCADFEKAVPVEHPLPDLDRIRSWVVADYRAQRHHRKLQASPDQN